MSILDDMRKEHGLIQGSLDSSGSALGASVLDELRDENDIDIYGKKREREKSQIKEEEQVRAHASTVDGDTIRTALGQTVRMLGIDTPETKDPRTGVEPFGPEATEAMQKQLPPDADVTLEPGFEDMDSYGRLLRFVEVNGGDAGKKQVEQGLAMLTSFDHPRRAAYVDALEGAVMGNLEMFSLPRHLDQQPTLEEIHKINVKNGLPGLLNEDGTPINTVFADGFEKTRVKRAQAALQKKMLQAETLINDIRKEELQQNPGATIADVQSLDELLPIKAGIQAMQGEPITAPMPNTARQIQFSLDDQGKSVRNEGKVLTGADRGLFGYDGESGRLATAAQAAQEFVGSGDENVPEKFIQRAVESVQNIGRGIGASGLEKSVDPNVRDLLAETRRVPEAEIENTPGFDVGDVAEFAGKSAPYMALAAIGPGGMGAAALAESQVGRLGVRVGVNALENLGIDKLYAAGEGREYTGQDALNSMAIGASVGLVFHGAAKGWARIRPAPLADEAVTRLVQANPELASRYLTAIEDRVPALAKMDIADPPAAQIAADVGENISRDAKVIAEGVEEATPGLKQALQGGGAEKATTQLAKEGDDVVWAQLAVDEALADAAENAANSGISRARRVYKENMFNNARAFAKQGQYDQAWSLIHKAQKGKRIAKQEAEDLKSALKEAMDARGAEALDAVDGHAQALTGDKPSVTTLKDLVERGEPIEPTHPAPAGKPPATGEEGFYTPEAVARAQRYEELPGQVRNALDKALKSETKPVKTKATKAWESVAENLQRLGRSGLPEAKAADDMLKNLRTLEESTQGTNVANVLLATADVRPQSAYLIHGRGSHFSNLIKGKLGIGAAEKRWAELSEEMWERAADVKSGDDWIRVINDLGKLHPEHKGAYEGMGKLLSVNQDGKMFMHVPDPKSPGGTAELIITPEELLQTMGRLSAHGGSKDMVEVLTTLTNDKVTKYARDVYNKQIDKSLIEVLKAMKKSKGYSIQDSQFVNRLREAISNSGGSTGAAGSLIRSYMGATRLPMVSVANIPQHIHTAYRAGVMNTAKALWSFHAPTWAGNANRARVRFQALADGSAADALISEQTNAMANFASSLSKEKASTASQRLAEWAAENSSKIVGEGYGLKAMERYLRTVSSEAGRLHTSNLLKRASQVGRTTDGMNAMKLAWSIMDNTNAEDPFFKSMLKNLNEGAGSSTQQLVRDLRELGGIESLDELVELSTLSDDVIDKSVARYFSSDKFRFADSPDTPALLARSMNRAGARVSEATQFRVGIRDVPLALNAPGLSRDFLRTVAQFNTYNLNHFTHIIRGHLIREAQRGNMIPLMRMMGVVLPGVAVGAEMKQQFVDFVNGGQSPGGNIFELAVDGFGGQVPVDEWMERLAHWNKWQNHLARTGEGFAAWGGIGAPQVLAESFGRGPGGLANAVMGPGPSTIASSMYHLFQAGRANTSDERLSEGISAVEDIAGNPFGITKTFTRRVRDQEGVGRDEEELNPTLLTRLISGPERTRARQVGAIENIRAERNTEAQEEYERVLDRLGVEREPEDDLVGRAEAGVAQKSRQAESTELKSRYLQAILDGDVAEQRSIKAEARAAGIKVDFRGLEAKVPGTPQAERARRREEFKERRSNR